MTNILDFSTHETLNLSTNTIETPEATNMELSSSPTSAIIIDNSKAGPEAAVPFLGNPNKATIQSSTRKILQFFQVLPRKRKKTIQRIQSWKTAATKKENNRNRNNRKRKNTDENIQLIGLQIECIWTNPSGKKASTFVPIHRWTPLIYS